MFLDAAAIVAILGAGATLLAVVSVGNAGTLDVWRIAAYGGGLFVPVRDALAGRAGGTYGGGRYLLDTIKGADLGPGDFPASIVLDLNFAYNPSCAYSPGYSCPVPPPENRLPVAIPAGVRSDH